MATERRLFTRLEDELIVRQARGEFTLKDLRAKLGANIKSIARRADELGVKLTFQRIHRARPPRKKDPRLSVHDSLTPASIGDEDKLLARLQLIHGGEK